MGFRHKLLSFLKVYLIFGMIGLCVYGNSFWNEFIQDDEHQIVLNPTIQSLSNFKEFFAGSTMFSGSENLTGIYYKPLMTLSYAVLWALGGNDPFPFHLFQFLVHLSNAVLLCYFVRRLIPGPVSWALGLIYLVHPLNTETIVYIADLQDTLYTFFGLLSLNYISRISNFSAQAVIWIFLGFLSAMLSKESGLLYIFISIAYASLLHKPALKASLIACVLALGSYAILRFVIADLVSVAHNVVAIAKADWWTRLQTAPAVLWNYLWKFIYPVKLTTATDWVVRDFSFQKFWGPLLAVSGILATSLAYLKKSRSPIFGFWLLWTIAGMGFHSHLIVPLDGTVADRWFYFSMIGVLGMIFTMLHRHIPSLHENSFRLRNAALPVVIFILLTTTLGARAHFRSLNWRSGYDIYTHDVEISPEDFILQNNAGVELFRRGRILEAKERFEKSTVLHSNWTVSWNNLGATYEALNNWSEAEKYYLRSIQAGVYYLAYENYAMILVRQGKYKEAIDFIEREGFLRFPGNQKMTTALTLSRQSLQIK